ncbi:hypothetical protein P0Y35_18995, partial [Kiritimatiellaeota bacterium B1221]|nr:hypothetical protein [Kiritimatiellaeota bacterium B1221]
SKHVDLSISILIVLLFRVPQFTWLHNPGIYPKGLQTTGSRQAIGIEIDMQNQSKSMPVDFLFR